MQVTQHGPGSPQSAHAVYAGTRRGRSRAQVHPSQWRAVRVPAERRPADRLPQRADPAGNVAADIAGVVALQVNRCAYRTRENAITETRREPLDLRLDPAGHVDGRA